MQLPYLCIKELIRTRLSFSQWLTVVQCAKVKKANLETFAIIKYLQLISRMILVMVDDEIIISLGYLICESDNFFTMERSKMK
jgi:hypothetical protein